MLVRDESWGRKVLACASTGAYPQLSWLDGGPRGRSVVGLSPAEEVRSDDLGVLADLPSGYWLGWLTYEAGVDATLGRAPRRRELSGVCLRRFDGLLAWGPAGVERLGDAAAASEIEDLLAFAPPWSVGPWPLERLRPCVDPAEYRRRVEAVLEEIRAGNTYQVNLSQPFRASFTDAARSRSWPERIAALYHGLRSDTPAPLGGLLLDGDRALVSNAPETLVHWTGGVVTSSPIKGTRPRGATPDEDQANVDALLASRKDAAEHVMIVDLVRNDLGRIAAPGSVVASARPELVTLPTVHHLVTDVHARLAGGLGLDALMAALFPGGSITGAPKIATLGIIERLEQVPRGLYCGGLVLITPERVSVNIAIRSGQCDRDGLTVHGGGGIVLDSDPEGERLESIAKVRAFDRDT
ncbi:MAG: anthranilate synthase component I family protein [Nannocystaceae bacterium]|nr:anthranilate synthase component I family protein [Nannocystaceae bacterium]